MVANFIIVIFAHIKNLVFHMKLATTVDEQIKILESRGVNIGSRDKARELLLDIGYFRLGFYCFPFEESYPAKTNRNHMYKRGTELKHIVELYYFDNDLRHILLKYLYRIEVNFRTKVVYISSNHFKKSPTWFVDPAIVTTSYAQSFEEKVYKQLRDGQEVIKRHHKNRLHINDKYAPAWKTLEFMTFGSVIKLFEAIRNQAVQEEIAMAFNVRNVKVFRSYLWVIQSARNICSHGGVLFDMSLSRSIAKGPAGKLTIGERHNLYGVVNVILYFIGQISKNRQKDLSNELSFLFETFKGNPIVASLIPQFGKIIEIKV